VFLFEIKNFLHGFIKPGQYFNIALYELAKVVDRELKLGEISALNTVSNDDLLAISGTNEKALKQYIGLPEIDSKALAMVQFIENPSRMSKMQNELFSQIKQTLNYKDEWLEGLV
jgi:ribosomal 30S subunit maturation factor RimM